MPERRSNRARNVTRPYRDIIVRRRRLRRLTLSVAGYCISGIHCETCQVRLSMHAPRMYLRGKLARFDTPSSIRRKLVEFIYVQRAKS